MHGCIRKSFTASIRQVFLLEMGWVGEAITTFYAMHPSFRRRCARYALRHWKIRYGILFISIYCITRKASLSFVLSHNWDFNDWNMFYSEVDAINANHFFVFFIFSFSLFKPKQFHVNLTGKMPCETNNRITLVKCCSSILKFRQLFSVKECIETYAQVKQT